MWNSMLMRVVMVVVLGITVFAGWWLYDLGKVRGVVELKSLRTQYSIVEKRNRKLVRDNKRLREQVAILDSSSQIDRQAAHEVKIDLEKLEEELQAAREEIEFYRGIVSPGNVQPGLRIHRFTLEAASRPGKYHYELVLTQLKHNDKSVTGTVDWTITGVLLGEPGALELAGVTRPPVKQLKFRFRYFQELAGTITLPEGFEPEKVVLNIKPAGKGKSKPPPVTRSFDWPDPDP